LRVSLRQRLCPPKDVGQVWSRSGSGSPKILRLWYKHSNRPVTVATWMWIPVFLFCSIAAVFGQETGVIPLLNPSLEGDIGHSKMPPGWYYCGPAGETPPDIHPNDFFGVELQPRHGRTFLGMVVRDNQTWESIGQQLARPLQKDNCYYLQICAARSDSYVSYSRSTGLPTNFNNKVRLRIWGGAGFGQKTELLAETPPVDSTQWRRFELRLRPRHEDLSHLIVEAYYAEDFSTYYSGNVLIDHLSPLVPENCTAPVASSTEISDTLNLALAGQPEFEIVVSREIRFAKNEQIPERLLLMPDGALVFGNPGLIRLLHADARKIGIGICCRGDGDQEQQKVSEIERLLQTYGSEDIKVKVLGRRATRSSAWRGQGDVFLKIKW
ncbi:MAG: hypothetical protein R3350_10770, partial [Saprospiraceae bacterium]|nr:hypothetical protein [Saprospiraceae bacterium]